MATRCAVGGIAHGASAQAAFVATPTGVIAVVGTRLGAHDLAVVHVPAGIRFLT